MDEEELQKQGVSIHAGFPNAAVGSHARQLNLSQLLIKHPSTTFMMRLDSNDWSDRGMFAGDIVLIDRSLSPYKDDTIVWWEHDQFVMSEQRKIPKDTPIWGVVTAVIHQTRKP